MPDLDQFEKWANKQSSKGKDIRITLMKQGDLHQFRQEYGVTKHINKRHCPFCGYKQLYESLEPLLSLSGETYDSTPFPTELHCVCRECKTESVIIITKEGVLPEEKMLIRTDSTNQAGIDNAEKDFEDREEIEPTEDLGPDEVDLEHDPYLEGIMGKESPNLDSVGD